VVVFGEVVVVSVAVVSVSSVVVAVVSVAGSGRNSCGRGGGVYTRGRSGRGAIVEVVVIGVIAVVEPDMAVPAVSLPSGFGFGMVKFVVVSTFVFVSGGVVSPGPLMVEVTPLADPSWTTSYCC